MGTLDIPDPETSPTFGQPIPDPAADPAPGPAERLPIVSAEVEVEPDSLPRFGSACRFCGMRAAADAMRLGGTYRLPEFATAPADATVRRVRLPVDAVGWKAAQEAKDRGDMQTYGRLRSGPVVQEVTMPSWRVCAACEALGRDPDPLALTFTAIGQPAPFSRTPTTIYVVERHQVQPYHAEGQPKDRGSRTPWAHAAETATAAAELLAELESAGGVPAPVGPGCGICGRTHSPYGWREATWRPPGTASATPPALSICNGSRVEPGDRSRHPLAEPVRRRVGCGLLLDMPPQAGTFTDLIYAEASRAGAASPHPGAVHPDDRNRFMAWSHPEFYRPAGARAPWRHMADVPVAPPSAEQRLAELEKLAGVSAG